jgi:predicted nucleic acid-binding protein
MILKTDSGPLIALMDERDRLNARAITALKRLGRRPLFTCAPVLTEVSFALPARYQRQRLAEFLRKLDVQVPPMKEERGFGDQVLSWLDRYAEHAPDFADAWLAVLSQHQRKLRVWTYDREFSGIWRRPDGSKVPLA